MSKTESLNISTFWFELSGPAAEYASSALGSEAISSQHLANKNLRTSAKILEQIYITMWSRESFVHSFTKDQKLKIEVVTKNKETSLKMFTRCHNGEILLQMKNSISALTQIMGIDCGIIEDITVTKMEPALVSIQEYDKMMERSQLTIMQLAKPDAYMELTEAGSSQATASFTAPGMATPSKTKEINTEVQLQHSEQVNINTGTVHHHHTTVSQVHLLDVESQGNKLKQELWSKAKARSKYSQPPVKIRKDYEMVQIEIAENTPMYGNSYDYETSLFQREQIVQTFSQTSGNISINEIFVKSREHVESQHPPSLNKQQSATDQQGKGNLVGVIGQAGIGKTTFTKTLIQQVFSGKFPEQVSYLFYLFIREIDFSRDCNVIQFLVRSALPEWEFTEEQDRALINKIAADKNVLIVLDGFDEALLTDSRYANISIHDQTTPELILLNLMSENILPLAKKVVTSRPGEMFSLYPPVRPAFLIRVLGLSKESQDILGQQICGESYTDLKMMLYKNPDLSLYWYVPIYCIMAFSYFANTENVKSIFLTLSSLLTSTLIDYAGTDHMRGKGIELEKLANLAWKGIVKRKCFFQLRDLEEVGLDYSTVQAFLQIALSKGLRFNMNILQGHQLTFFSHLIWQEYFASIYIMLKLSTKDLDLQLKTNIYSEVVEKFLFGLCNRQIFFQLQVIIPDYSTENWVAKKRLLAEHLEAQVGWSYYSLLWAGSLLLEAQDDSMLASVIDVLKSKEDKSAIILEGSVLPSDVASLCYLCKGFVNLGGRIESVAVGTYPGRHNQCIFVEDAFYRLADAVKSGIKMTKFVLSDVKFGDKGAKAISGCIPQVQCLLVERCNITQNGLPDIVEKLSDLAEPIMELKLGGNKLTDFGAELLAPCIPHIQQLHLDDCDITHIGVEKVVKYLLLLPEPIQYLNLAGNRVGNEGATMLSRCLHNIKKLILLMCHITEEGVTKLATKAKDLENKMDLLDLSENEIGEKGVQALSHCKGKIGELKLHFCAVSADQKELLKGIAVEYKSQTNTKRQLNFTYSNAPFLHEDLFS